MLAGKRILLVVSGGIAAYKALELIRRLREQGAAVRCILTRAGAEFVTPLSLQALSEDKVYGELFSLTDESEMGHIQLSRDADLLVVAPASADILAKITHGMADDLATTALLATDKDVLVAPAMNVRMWEHPATQENLATLRRRGVHVVGPNEGPMACGEYGFGRMAEPAEILAAIGSYFGADAPLAGRKALVTSGPTHEPIDPVRYIANRSSGRQGHAIAAALARLGAATTLVTGPTQQPDPPGVTVRHVESARDMLAACQAALPVDAAVCAAAVADWRVASAADQKMKREGHDGLKLEFTQNPDILATLSEVGNLRPRLVVGFAAETENVIDHARAKRARKGCDWIVANDVSPATGTFGGAENTVHLIVDGASEPETWPRMSKADVGERLARRIADHLIQPAAEASSA
ncbi:bifunctional phosphopantothenoylcysteine decarboxylase/phosphopantothenate--cysteine ligase CoaBC [Ferruginivarius sediminum]|uniref:Coenzyme A biosynthesis bifunctional protein CoaBC n=1 Tax=Ferruginivarius sediminum TaxID=2661937 RepID=A0A369TGV4_9PROT|nr:bifunctional phosphopantothenoylcysteine decarboxylase/phosphopantothenate--cysteine ligase CoaBC [Ferruginivarius sediminum]RDD63367.1 bifunctional phosphopantothenoylcysteine decarboxylase/phosphopantothenate--cysteine ligase CoaBC [Ferruginivarius sediminum]